MLAKKSVVSFKFSHRYASNQVSRPVFWKNMCQGSLPLSQFTTFNNCFKVVGSSMRHFSIITDSSGGTSGPSDMDSEAAAKASARDFLEKVEEDLIIDEINSVEEWTTKVMDVKDRPIILDCYAEWCSPCKKLTPILEDVTKANDGKFKLIKLNIDNIPQLTKALQVRSIPTLFLIYRGNVIDTITGVDQAKLDEFVKTALLVEQA